MASKEGLTTGSEPSSTEHGRSTNTTPCAVSNANYFTNEDYTVGWICALPNELAASQAMLDQKHPDILQAEKDSNTYTLGRIGPHNFVLACLPSGAIGTNPAAVAAANLVRTFPKIRFGLMVGIGGGAPGEPSDDPSEDLRLGDVVVSNPEGNQGGVVQYDFGKTIEGGKFTQTGSLDRPPAVLRSAVSKLRAQHVSDGSAIPRYVSEMLQSKPRMAKTFQHQGSKHDQLFEASYDHDGGGRGCEKCDKEHLLAREPRDTTDPVIHYGLIASANQVMKHGATREKLRREKGVLCFEMEAAGLMDTFPCLVIRGICDYSDTHKNKRWQPYAAATAAAYAKELLEIIPANQVTSIKEAAEIVKLIVAIDEKLEPLWNDQKRKERDEILDWLAPSTHETQYMDNLEKWQQGTGQWFLNSPEFAAWVSGRSPALLCFGIPGAGKTIIASVAIEHLRSTRNSKGLRVAFLYCNYRMREKQSAKNLLAVLLRQLAEQCLSVPESVKELYASCKRKKTGPSFPEILDTLSRVIGSQERAFLVIDALDECSDEARKTLLTKLQELRRNTKTSVMATSRPHGLLEREFEGDARLEIRAVERDIDLYLDGQLKGLSECVTGNDALQKTIKKCVAEAAGGMFLLASLHLESLKGKRTEGHIEEALQALPKGADALSIAYKSVVERIDSHEKDDRNWARRVLSWVVYVKRPLSPTELHHALAIRRGDREFKTKYLPSLGEVISLCAGLVALNDKSDVVQLVHYTAQQYFEDGQHQPKWIRTASADIATTCITYLSFDAFEAGFCPTDNEFETRLQQNPLYDYAARNWGHHVRAASIEEEQLILDLLKSGAKVSAASQAMMAAGRYYDYSQSVPRQMTGAHLAAYFGLNETTTALLRSGHDPNVKDTYGRTPLWWAVLNRHEVVVKLLLDREGINPDSKDKYSQTPLSRAAQNGHEVVVKLLLDKEGVDPDSKDNGGLTPLWLAAQNGHETVVKLLLDKEGVDPDSKDRDGWTPLLWAACNGYETVVKLLLDKEGVDSGSKDKHGRTPLSCAANNGHAAVVKLLLDKEGIDPDPKDEDDWTPLRGAAYNGHETVVKLLLDKEGVDPDSMDKYGRTPLSCAAYNGHEAVIKLLLGKGGVDPDPKNEGGWTPLWWAVHNGHETIVKLLLDKEGVDPDSKDEYGRTPLSWAANNGHEAVVKLLLGKGGVDPDLDSRDKHGWTPLLWAAYNGREAVVRLLLDTGDVDSDSKDEDGRTPLWWATQNGHEAVVKLLQSRGALSL